MQSHLKGYFGISQKVLWSIALIFLMELVTYMPTYMR